MFVLMPGSLRCSGFICDSEHIQSGLSRCAFLLLRLRVGLFAVLLLPLRVLLLIRVHPGFLLAHPLLLVLFCGSFVNASTFGVVR